MLLVNVYKWTTVAGCGSKRLFSVSDVRRCWIRWR